ILLRDVVDGAAGAGRGFGHEASLPHGRVMAAHPCAATCARTGVTGDTFDATNATATPSPPKVGTPAPRRRDAARMPRNRGPMKTTELPQRDEVLERAVRELSRRTRFPIAFGGLVDGDV